MVIIVDVSILLEDLRHIIDDIEHKSRSKGSHTKSQIKTTVDVKPYKNSVDIVTLNYNYTEIYEIKQMVKDILIKRGLIDYVAIEDQDEGNNLKIVRKDHAERLGIYHYRYCGMVFENEIQLGIHQRIHYFIYPHQ